MKVYLKKSPRFGVVYYSPKCPISKLICEFARRKAFLEDELPKLEEMGFKVEIVNVEKSSKSL